MRAAVRQDTICDLRFWDDRAPASKKTFQNLFLFLVKVCMAAVTQDRLAMSLVSQELRHEEEFLLELVAAGCPYLLEYAPDHLIKHGKTGTRLQTESLEP